MFKTFLDLGLGFGVLHGQEQVPDERLRTATTVLHEILSDPDKADRKTTWQKPNVS